MKKNTKGFTLIELLAVIVILGILVAIAIPSVTKILENSRKSTYIANANELINTARLNETQNPKGANGIYNFKTGEAEAALLEKAITTSPWGKTITVAKVTVGADAETYSICLGDGTNYISGTEASINLANYTISATACS